MLILTSSRAKVESHRRLRGPRSALPRDGLGAPVELGADGITLLELEVVVLGGGRMEELTQGDGGTREPVRERGRAKLLPPVEQRDGRIGERLRPGGDLVAEGRLVVVRRSVLEQG